MYAKEIRCRTYKYQQKSAWSHLASIPPFKHCSDLIWPLFLELFFATNRIRTRSSKIKVYNISTKGFILSVLVLIFPLILFPLQLEERHRPLEKNVLCKKINLSLLSYVGMIFLKKRVILSFFNRNLTCVASDSLHSLIICSKTW